MQWLRIYREATFKSSRSITMTLKLLATELTTSNGLPIYWNWCIWNSLSLDQPPLLDYDRNLGEKPRCSRLLAKYLQLLNISRRCWYELVFMLITSAFCSSSRQSSSLKYFRFSCRLLQSKERLVDLSKQESPPNQGTPPIQRHVRNKGRRYPPLPESSPRQSQVHGNASMTCTQGRERQSP